MERKTTLVSLRILTNLNLEIMKEKQQISTYIYKEEEALYLYVILRFDRSFVTGL